MLGELVEQISNPNLQTLSLHGPDGLIRAIADDYSNRTHLPERAEFSLPQDKLDGLMSWAINTQPVILELISKLKGNSSFMCYMGIHRSGHLAKLAQTKGTTRVVSNELNQWVPVNGHYFA